MARIALGSTGIVAEQNGFGALPIQRVSGEEAVRLFRRAYDGGITFYDTARGYSDSEAKLAQAFAGMRDRVTIATKTHAHDAAGYLRDLETSLRELRTDTIDLYQFHNPTVMPAPGDESGLYKAMLAAKAQGKIRHIGITNHRMDVARQIIASGLYETLQYPFNYLSTEQEQGMVRSCLESGMGCIAMKALSGGLITNAGAACAWMIHFGPVVPIWGIQRERELDEFLRYIQRPPALDAAMEATIVADRQELNGDFCRACGYCMPCPQGIVINMAARASLLLRRAPTDMLLSENGQATMRKVEDCVESYQCAAKCPYELDTPALLKKNYRDYCEVLAGKPL